MLNRRQFVTQAAVLAGAAAALSAETDAALAAPPLAVTDRIKLGKTGIKSSLIGIGTGSVGWNHQSNQTRLGQAKFTELIRHAYDSGVRFFDCADQYGSMPFLKEAIKGIPRDTFVIQSKIIHRDPQQARDDLDRFRRELGVDYIDTVLMHVVTEADWNVRYKGVQDVLSEAKQKGIIRAHGCSCHTVDALRTASRDPWVEVDLARFNPWGKYMDMAPGTREADAPATVGTVLKQMRAAGKGVIGMKILAQGDIMKATDGSVSARASIHHALTSGAVDMMVIGFESPQQINEIVATTSGVLDEIHGRNGVREQVG